MFRGHHSVTIARPVNEVFEYVSNPNNMSAWEDGVLESQTTTPTPIAVGSKGYIIVRLMAKVRVTWEVIQYEPHHLMRMRTASGPLRVEGFFRCEPATGGTLFTVVYEARALGPFKLLEPLMSRMRRRQFERSMPRLKRILEAKTPAS